MSSVALATFLTSERSKKAERHGTLTASSAKAASRWVQESRKARNADSLQCKSGLSMERSEFLCFLYWVHPVTLDLIDFNYRLYNFCILATLHAVSPCIHKIIAFQVYNSLYTAYRPPAYKLRKWLMRNYICSKAGRYTDISIYCGIELKPVWL